MSSKPLLYLDFDGVICNSLEECYQSSWLAWKALPLDAASPPPPAPEDPAWRQAFVALRPYIRSGEDYLLAHELITAGEAVDSQTAFDAALARAGKDRMAAWKKDLYAVRSFLTTHHLALWASWNPLYPGMEDLMRTLVSEPRAWILSTKKSPYVLAILQHHGIPWPADRTLEAVGKSKLAIITDALARSDAQAAPLEPAAILVDDQVDHLDFRRADIASYWALWGFVTPGATAPTDRTLNLEAALAFLKNWRHAA